MKKHTVKVTENFDLESVPSGVEIIKAQARKEILATMSRWLERELAMEDDSKFCRVLLAMSQWVDEELGLPGNSGLMDDDGPPDMADQEYERWRDEVMEREVHEELKANWAPYDFEDHLYREHRDLRLLGEAQEVGVAA